MTTPYEMFKTKEVKLSKQPAVLDYDKFKIFVKYGGPSNRAFIDGYNLKMRRFTRRQALADQGKLTDEAADLLEKDRTRAMAELYADHIIVGWEGVKDEKGKVMEYNRQNVIKLLTDLDPLFADIISQSAEEANFAEEERKAEEKN